MTKLATANEPINIVNPSTNPNQALWEKGDFTRIADTMRESGEALVQRIGITKGLKVLDLECEDGTTALPAAKFGANVLGVDIARNQLKPATNARQSTALQTSNFRKATPPTCTSCRTKRLISPCPSLERCSRPSHLMSPKK